MQLKSRPLKFQTITHHASVTQCLGSIGGHVWHLGVVKLSIVDSKDDTGTDGLQSCCRHFYLPPAVHEVRVFRIAGPKFLKLNVGSRRAGPVLKQTTWTSKILELSNTNGRFLHHFFSPISMLFDAYES